VPKQGENIGRVLPPNLPKDANDGESHIRLSRSDSACFAAHFYIQKVGIDLTG
jgi:hypothetical protein